MSLRAWIIKEKLVSIQNVEYGCCQITSLLLLKLPWQRDMENIREVSKHYNTHNEHN